MSCLLTSGRDEQCKESIGGLQAVYFINYATGSFSKDGNGQIDDLSGYTVYAYELKGTSAYT